MTINTTEVYSFLLGLSGFIISITTALGIILKAWQKAHKPETECIQMTKKHDEILQKHESELKELEASNTITQRALLALLEHALQPEKVDAIEKAKEELTDYLINKK